MKTKFWIIGFVLFCFTGCLLANHYNLFKLSNITEYQTPGYTKKHQDSLIKFAKENGYNAHLGIFINFSKHSGSNRLFLVDLDSNKLLVQGLCCHGRGKNNFKERVIFSNEIGENCSSQGFYKIGYKYNGTFGTAYKLTGLSPTNSNAFDRFVVLHGHDCVPNSTVPVAICQSLGCPTLAPEVLKKLEPYLDSSKKPILLWIY